MRDSSMLKRAFKNLFHKLPEFCKKYPKDLEPISNVCFPKSGANKKASRVAFAQFYDGVLTTTALYMSGVNIGGRRINVSRAHSYKPIIQGLPALDVSPLQELGLLYSEQLPRHSPDPLLQLSADGRSMPSFVTADSTGIPKCVMVGGGQTRSSKLELFFGNLHVGHVDESVMTEFLTPVCEKFEEYEICKGPAITKVTMGHTGMYCFVQFQNEAMLPCARAAFDGVMLKGRPLRIRESSQAPRSLN